MKFMYFNLNQITTLRNRKFSRIPMVRFKSTLWIPAYRHNVSGVEIIRKKMCKFLLSNENYAFLFSQTAQTCSQSNPKLNEMNKKKTLTANCVTFILELNYLLFSLSCSRLHSMHMFHQSSNWNAFKSLRRMNKLCRCIYLYASHEWNRSCKNIKLTTIILTQQ